MTNLPKNKSEIVKSNQGMPDIDFQALGNSIIEGGPDSMVARINTHHSIPIEEFQKGLEAILGQDNFNARELQSNFSTDTVAYFFESYPVAEIADPNVKLLGTAKENKIVKAFKSITNPSEPEHIGLANLYPQSFQGKGSVRAKWAIISRTKGLDFLKLYKELAAGVENFTFQNGGYIVDKKRKLNNELTTDQLAQLEGKANYFSIVTESLTKKLPEIKKIAEDKGLIVHQYAILADSPNMDIKDENNKGHFKISDDLSTKQTRLTLYDFDNPSLMDFYVEVVNILSTEGVKAGVNRQYNKIINPKKEFCVYPYHATTLRTISFDLK